jgi:hypothetical protein
MQGRGWGLCRKHMSCPDEVADELSGFISSGRRLSLPVSRRMNLIAMSAYILEAVLAAVQQKNAGDKETQD